MCKAPYGDDANANAITIAIATRDARTAALPIDQPVDIINATIDKFIAQSVELPAWRRGRAAQGQLNGRVMSMGHKLLDEHRRCIEKRRD